MRKAKLKDLSQEPGATANAGFGAETLVQGDL